MDRNAPMTIPELGLLALIAVLKGPPIYYCIRVKLRPRRKKKSKRDNGLFCLFSKCTCVDVMYFVPVCTCAYHMEKRKTHNGSEP